MHFVAKLVKTMGPLRVLLALTTLILILFPSPPGTQLSYSGWGLYASLVAPVLAPIVLMGLLLDLLMTRVWLSELEGQARQAMKSVAWLDLALAIALCLAWLPFFMSLGRP